MPGPTKRTRADANANENDPTNTPTPTSTPSTPTSSAPITRTNSALRRPTTTATAITPSLTGATAATAPGPSPPRPILTRSAATQPHPPSNSGLTRSTSLFSISTRRTNFDAPSASSSASSSGFNFGLGLPGPGPAPLASGSSSSGRGGTLVRAQSTSSLTSPTSLKAAVAVAPGGGGNGRGKGGDDDENGNSGPRRFGKGKENIPPKKDEDREEGPSRKRPRVNSRASMNGRRGRSNSIVSVRSETSGRHSSLAPSSSCSSIASWHNARLPSPSPSQSSFTTPSIETATSADPLDLLKDEGDDYFDVDRTPTKKRPVTRATAGLPTPPPSSPSVTSASASADVEGATRRVSLVRLQSGLSDKTEVDEDGDVNLDQTDGGKPKQNAYKQLKSLLRLSSTVTGENATVDQTIIGRDSEKAVLRQYLNTTADQDVGLYVSGPPGTGKTALVTALGREIASDGWKVVELGCMGLKVTDIWRRLGEELGSGKSEREVKDCLQATKVFIILDEVDSLMPPPPSTAPPATSHLLTKLFSLPLSTPTKLIAISNTLDLTLRARLVLPDSLQPQVLPFKAYGAVDMASIVNARVVAAAVDEVKVDTKAVELLTRKVEAQNGDLRMCLGVLSSAISLAEAEWLKKLSNASITGTAVENQSPPVPMVKVSLPHVLKAFTSHAQQLRAAAGSSSGNASSTGKKIRSVPLQGKMVLVSMLIFLSRARAGLNGCPAIGSGAVTPPHTPSKNSISGSEITISNLYATYAHILSHTTSPFPPAAESDYRDLLSNLETLGLVALPNSSNNGLSTRSGTSAGMGRTKSASHGGGRVELCVKEEEVREGLGLVDGANKGVAEEEVKRVWEREEGKVRRVREKAALAQQQQGEAGELF